jgi:O-methyltransferase
MFSIKLVSFFGNLNLKMYKYLKIRITQNAPFGSSLESLDSDAYRIIQAVKSRTMTDENRIYNAIIAARYISENRIQGDIVECGVWRGGSMMAMAMALVKLEDSKRDLFLYDTYQGMTAPTAIDIRFDGLTANYLLEEENESKSFEYSKGVQAFASITDVEAGMESTNYPTSAIHYKVGDVLQTLNLNSHESVSLVRLDTDWYESTRHELEILWPKIVVGGILIIDDYDHWNGARQAADEFFRSLSVKPLLMAMNSGRLVLKL